MKRPTAKTKRSSSPTAFRAFLRQTDSSETQNPGRGHCAVLYRTNSQSRLVEEALRRYGIRYTMVGGFSFYERAEIKDLLSYLRLVRNPHDSMALQRVINTPARGIGKTTLDTLERLALETGQSTWDAMAAAIANRLIPTRALMALESFRQLILDAQAMMDPDFAGKLSADVAESAADAGDTDFAFGAESTQSTEAAGRAGLEAAHRFQLWRLTKIRCRCSMQATSRPSPPSRSARFSRCRSRRAKPGADPDRVPPNPTVGSGKESHRTADPHQKQKGAEALSEIPATPPLFPSSSASSSTAPATSRRLKPKPRPKPSAALKT